MTADALAFDPRLVVHGSGELHEAVSVLAWSGDGLAVAAGSLGGDVALAGKDGSVLARLDAGAPVVDACWSARGAVLAVACEDGAVWLWRRGSEPVRHPVGQTADQLAWGARGLAVATGSAVVLLDPSGRRRTELPTPPGAAVVVTWSSGDAVLLAGGLGGLREVLVSEPGGETWPRAAVVTLAVDPTSGVVAAGTLGGDVELVDRGRGAGAALHLARDPVERLAWSSLRSLLAVVADGALRVCALRPDGGGMTGPRHLAGHDDRVTDAAFAPAGPLLASVGLDGRLVLWDPSATADPLERCDVDGEPAVVSWRPDGRALAVGARNGAFTVLDCSRLLPPPA